MMELKKTIFIVLLLFSTLVIGQVGINVENPKSTLDVGVKRNSVGVITDNTQTYGIQSPRLTRAELTANTGKYGSDQTGAIIYITDISAGNTSGNRVNIDAVGYYYFDGNLWQKLSGNDSIVTVSNGLTQTATNISLGGTLDKNTNIETAGKNLTITGTGNLGIGTTTPKAKIHVNTADGVGFQLQDGTEGVDKILTSDANGLATWATINSSKKTVIGSTRTAGGNQFCVSNTVINNTKINLTKGFWLVYIGQLVNGQYPSNETNNAWIRFTLSDTGTNGVPTQKYFNMPTVANQTNKRALVSTVTSGFKVAGPNYYSFASGIILVEVTDTPNPDETLTLYLSFEENVYVGSIANYYTYVSNNRENYFFAIPVNQ